MSQAGFTYGIRGEVRQLTGLRGLAALDVMMGHYNEEQVPFLHWLEFTNAAVDIFFCLSGFTLCLVYGMGLRHRFDVRDYAVARFARIYPLYALVTAVALWYTVNWGLNGYATYTLSGLVGDGIRQLLLVNAWPVVGTGAFWVDAAWSVSIEAFCYVAIFPAMFFLSLKARNLPAQPVACLMLLLPAFSYFFFKLHFDPSIDTHGFPPPASRLAYWVPLTRGITMFMSGCLAYLIWLRHDKVAQAAGITTDAACALFIASLAGQAWGVIDVQLTVMLAPLIVLGLMDGGSVSARILSFRPVHYLGVISYSVYLLHRPVALFIVYHYPFVRARADTRILIPMAVTLVLSTVSFYMVEAPARRLLRRMLGRRLPAQTLAT